MKAWWLLLGLLAACAAPATQPPTSSPPPPAPKATATTGADSRASCPEGAPWRMLLERSGGFAGWIQRVEVLDNGLVQVHDLKPPAEASLRLPAEDLAGLAKQVRQACLAAGAPPEPLPACADCFLYRLEGTYAETRFALEWNDINLEDSPLAPLVQRLLDLHDRALEGG